MNHHNRQFIYWCRYALAPLFGSLLYAALLYIHLPQTVGLAFRYDATYVAVLAGGLFLLALCLPGMKGEIAGWLVTFALFALPLAGMWGSSVRDSYVLGSLLPTGDATRFYLDATRLLEGWQFNASGWRPLYPALLSSLLFISQQNLQLAVALQGALLAAACYLAARELQRTHGSIAASLLLTLLFLYSRRFSGTTMTENLGVAFAALGLALLWRAAYSRSRWHLFSGVALAALALYARPGCYFMLPALMLWAGRLWRTSRPLAWNMAGWALSAVVLSYAVNITLSHVLTEPGKDLSNFNLTLYGQVAGGKGWNQVHEDYPQIRDLPEPQHSEKVYQLAFDTFRRQPGLLLKGVLKSWGAFFSVSQEGVFGFVGKEGSAATLPSRLLLYALALAGLFSFSSSAGNDEPAVRSLLSFLLIGIVLSVPFVPPWDGAGMRLYAASLPLLALLPALGMAFVCDRLKCLPRLSLPCRVTPAPLLPAFSILLCLLALIAPLVLYVLIKPQQFKQIDCPADLEAVYVRIIPGASITIVDDEDVPYTRLPYIRQSEFTGSNHSFGYTEVADELDRLLVPATIQNAMDLVSGETVWLIVGRENDMPVDSGLVAACGRWSSGVGLNDWFFYGDEMIPLDGAH